jgi:hypothetical protein
MKYLKRIFLFAVITLVLSSFLHCSKITGGLDDQAPVLIVKINTTGAITINNTYKAYIIYYNDATWTTPWFTYGTASDTLFNPAVGTSSTYLAVFWDHQAVGVGPGDGNGIPDAGEPCTGYKNANHSAAEPMTKITFIPLEWRSIVINLDTAVVY